MFQFAHVPLPCLCVQQGVSRHHSRGVASFGYSGLIACMQLPLNVSPVSASFFGIERQGIRLVRCVACFSFVCLLFPAPTALWLRSMERKFLCFSLALRQN